MRSWIVVAVALLCTACPCDPGVREVFLDGLESRCGDLPCGWTVESGTVERVGTFHAGEHGMKLTDARVSRDLPGIRLSTDEEASDYVHFLAWCDPTAGLQITVQVEQDSIPASLTGRIEPGEVARDGLMLNTGASLGGRTLPYVFTEATSIAFEIVGSGSCTIDEIRILSGDNLQCMG